MGIPIDEAVTICCTMLRVRSQVHNFRPMRVRLRSSMLWSLIISALLWTTSIPAWSADECTGKFARNSPTKEELLELLAAQNEASSNAVFPKPDELVLSVCGAIKSVAEIVPSVPGYCKSALDEAAHGSQIAGVFRQEDVWLCVAVDPAGQIKIHAVLVAQA